MSLTIAFDNSYARLPAPFYARTRPEPAPAPELVLLNETLALDLRLDPAELVSAEGVAMLSGRELPAGADPIALAYAGHQFGNFVPTLGDGRAHLIGEVIDRHGVRRDIQLKGSGRTPFSRRGDGKAVIGPVLREFIVSEAMSALGIPTTRSLAATVTGETVWRERPVPGAVLTRVARSHVRVGTFQYFAARSDEDSLRILADYVIERLYPELAGRVEAYADLYAAMVERQARLIADWLSVGFIHGVMNTDNMAVSGETIDYGPCAFMDQYDPARVLSSIDSGGRYAYGRQPQIAQWNLARLGECLLPLISGDREAATAIVVERLSGFAERFEAAYFGRLAAKLGLGGDQPDDQSLVTDFLRALQAGAADFTLAFRRLADVVDPASDVAPFATLFGNGVDMAGWLGAWRVRLAAGNRSPEEIRATLNAINPAVIPRNHQIETALVAAEDGDLRPCHRLLTALARPFDEPDDVDLTLPPRPEQVVPATFCGT